MTEQVQGAHRRHAGCHPADHQQRAGAEVEAGERGEPGGHRQPGEPQIRRRRLVVGNARVVSSPCARRLPLVGGAVGAHTVTRSLSCSYRASPIPSTWRRSPTDLNPPC
ncbi:hypothetical protein NKG94_44720 [Micromonospora sp. M12]